MKKYLLDRIILPIEIVHTAYNPELVNQLEVKSIFTDQFESSEYWGWNEEGENNLPHYEFGRIGRDFHFDISHTQSRFYSGTGIIIGYKKEDPHLLKMYDDSSLINNETDILISWFHPEKIYPKRPGTMWDLLMFINDYFHLVEQQFESMSMKHNKKYSQQSVSVFPSDINNDLPF